MKILHLTREYPPYVYGGAGVHVENLTRELARLTRIEIRCFGDQQSEGEDGGPSVSGFAPWNSVLTRTDPRLRKAIEPLSVDLAMAATPTDADLVHCHTWYSMMAGLWIRILYNIPLVITTHSLEPLRPWKAEQLGRGYVLSRWIEKTAVESADAVIAVSEVTRREILQCYAVDPTRIQVIHNGIDLDLYRRVDPAPVLQRYGIPAGQPYLLFVGRMARQKGMIHLLRALQSVDPALHAVLCAGAPDTEEIGREIRQAVEELQSRRAGVFWIRDMLSPQELVAFYSGALLFVCPSIYEPFGIINLEAMATECPVVASRVGGIPEVVVDGETGLLVPLEGRGLPDFEPRDPEKFAGQLAAAINRLFQDPELCRRMGKAGRCRVEEHFSWQQIARRTLELYEQLKRDG